MSDMDQGRVPDLSAESSGRPVLPPHRPLTLNDHAAHLASTAAALRAAVEGILDIALATQIAPELRQVTIDGTKSYTVTDRSQWEAKSIAIINPSAMSIYVGVNSSATPTSGAPVCRPQSMLVLPVHAYDLDLGADPAQLLAQTVAFQVMRFASVQRPFVGKMT